MRQKKTKPKRSRKKWPICDYHGVCKNKAYCEVYPMAMGGKHEDRGWSYLCKKHLTQEQEIYKGKLPYSTVVEY